MLIVHPCDRTSLRGATEAAELGITNPILVGPPRRQLRDFRLYAALWLAFEEVNGFPGRSTMLISGLCERKAFPFEGTPHRIVARPAVMIKDFKSFRRLDQYRLD
jgi:hypothetical protein